jgi:NitT/TauT family transport system substrate-binding protein
MIRFALKVTLLAVVLAGVAASTQAQGPLTVRFGVDQFILGAPVHVAAELGIFRRYGIRPVIQPFPLGIDTVDAVLAGRTDVGFALDFPLLIRLQTGQLRVVAAVIEPEGGFHKLAVRRGINTAADLRGKRLGIAQGTAQHYVTLKYLQNSGVALSEVSLVPLPSLFEIIAALRRGTIDAAWVWAQGTDEAQQIEGVRILTDDRVVRQTSFGFMTVSRQFLASNPDTLVAVLRAIIEATEWMNRNMPVAARIIASRNGAPEDRTLTELRRQNATVSLERKHIDALVDLLDFMLTNQIIRTRVTVPDFFVVRPLRQADPARVKL